MLVHVIVNYFKRAVFCKVKLIVNYSPVPGVMKGLINSGSFLMSPMAAKGIAQFATEIKTQKRLLINMIQYMSML